MAIRRGQQRSARFQGPQPTPDAEIVNSFTAGLKTEFTGLNFPENSCTAVSNCVFTLQGDVVRRNGIDFEANFAYTNGVTNVNNAVVMYKWNNVGGDGLTQMIVVQIGIFLYFFQSTNATTTTPLSMQNVLQAPLNFSLFQVVGNTQNVSQVECQFSDGNGYLFIFHPACDPLYVTFSPGIINLVTLTPPLTLNKISMQIRDFQGIPENLAPNFRPLTLTNEHNYNVQNQGWLNKPTWSFSANSPSQTIFTGTAFQMTLNAPTGLSINPGDQFSASGQLYVVGYHVTGYYGVYSGGTVFSYNSTTGVVILNINGFSSVPTGVGTLYYMNVSSLNTSLITTWHTAEGSYPSNSDIWFLYKDSTGVFNPSTTQPNITINAGPAPNGAFILNAFYQDRAAISGVPNLTVVNTLQRPKTGCWFQGRVWYSGVDATFPAQGDAPFTTWTENIYFSQTVQVPTDFGVCYQSNDPTSEFFSQLLPSDGGVIVIQGSGSIYKLFPITNGLIVFAANGIWFITGNTGIGFTANDFTVTKISNVRSISGTSIVNVLGYPVFWNEEGIYSVTPNQTNSAYAFGGLNVQNMVLGTIKSFYASIPLQSKKFARGDYNPVNFVITWVYKGVNEQGIQDRYIYDSALCYNTALNSFYIYALDPPNVDIGGVIYLEGPGGSNSPAPVFKYISFTVGNQMTFAEERDNVNWVDFISYDGIGINYTSFFQTGYTPKGSFFAKIQPQYVNIYTRGTGTSYQIQSIFDFATDPQSGRFSTPQIMLDQNQAFYGNIRKRHRIRGNGYTFQIFISSVQGQPFDIMGWSVYETKTVGVA